MSCGYEERCPLWPDCPEDCPVWQAAEAAEREGRRELYDDLEGRSEALLVRALEYAEGVLERAEGMKPEDALKVINRATSVAKQLIELLRYLKRAEERASKRADESGDAGGSGDEPEDGGVDEGLHGDARAAIVGVGPGRDADAAGG